MGGSKSKLLQETCETCLAYVGELDEAVMSFLKKLDDMTATLRVISFYHSSSSKPLTVSEADDTIIFSEKKLTQDVLCRIEQSISSNKNETLQKLRKLIRFINDTVEKNTSLKPKKLQLDNYKGDPSNETFFIDGVKNARSNEIKKLIDKQNMLKEQLNIVQSREESLLKDRKEILSEKSAVYQLNDQKEKENEELRNKLRNIKHEMERQRAEDQPKWEVEKDSFNKTISGMNERIESLETEIESYKTDLKAERSITDELRDENCRLQDELESYKSKKVLQVQLFYQRRGGLIAEVEEGLKGVLKSRLEDGKTELKFITCNSSSQINPDIPTLLIAICASRIGTDAANAIQGLDMYLSKRILLLIFHHKDIHALPSQASERVLTGPEFKSLGGIHDMAFLSQKGIYECEMNENSIATVTSFLTSS